MAKSKLSPKVKQKIVKAKENKSNVLDLSFCNLIEVPKEVFKLINLTYLNLSSNKLTELSTEIGQLTNLTHLHLSANSLTQLPAEISQLTNLTSLNFSFNSLTQLPIEIGQLPNLTHLYLNSNSLTQLPIEIGQLSNLTDLYLSFNSLTQLPTGIGQLTNLTHLYLSANSLIQFPPAIEQLANLTVLDLRSNLLKRLPTKIGQLTHLKMIKLKGNLLEDPPPEIVQQGTKAILNYLNEKLKGLDHIYEAKLLIVGEERAGKTSLMKSLTIPQYQLEDEQSTEGINIRSWHIPKNKTLFEKDFRLNVWDFGGQEIYHATHQFFLTKRSLYLLVNEPRQEIRHDDFYYWLNIISLLGDDSPVLLVQNKCDQPLEDIPVREYKESFENIIGNLERTSCKPDRKETINITAQC